MSNMPHHNSFNDAHRVEATMWAAFVAGDGLFDPYKVVTSNLEVALNYANAGMSVFPCKSAPGIKGEDKKPIGVRSWTKESTTDETIIRAWWRKYPDALVAIDCSKSGLVVIDADRHEGPDGVAAFDDLVDANGGLTGYGPLTLTASNGQHHFFLQPADGKPLGNSEGDLKGRGINVRGAGGYVIAQGSMREDCESGWLLAGSPYPGVAEAYAAGTIPVIPNWLVDLIRATKQRDDAPEQPEPDSGGAELPSGAEQPLGAQRAPATSLSLNERQQRRARAWAEKALDDETKKLAAAIRGGRNNQLNDSAFAMGQIAAHAQIAAHGLMTRTEVWSALQGASRANGYIADKKMKAFNDTFNSGFPDGRSNPRKTPDFSKDEGSEYDREIELLADDIGRRVDEAYASRKIEEAEDGTLFDPQTGEVINTAKAPTSSINYELPEHLTRPAGVLGDIVNWVTDSAQRPKRILSLGTAIAAVSTIIGRRVAGPTRSGTHQYIIALAKSGGGKDHPLRRSTALLRAVEESLAGPGDFTSQNAFVHHVSNNPLSLCAMDELGVFVARACDKKGTSWERGMTKVLREYWGASFDVVQGTQWANQKSEPIKWPALSLFGVSTHDEFFGALSSREVTNGFLNRFLMISTAAKDTINFDPPASASKIPQEISQSLAELYADCRGNDDLSNFLRDERDITRRFNDDAQIVIGWADDKVRDEYRQLAMRALSKADGSTIGEVYSRTAEMAVRLATIHAVSRAGLDAKVTSEDFAWGSGLALWSADTMAREASMRMADTEAQARANLVLQIVSGAGGKIKHRDLNRDLRCKLKPQEFKDAITALVESGTIQKLTIRPPKGGTPSVVYIIPDDAGEPGV